MQSQETDEAMGVQGAKPPAGARGVPALSLFPQRWAENALAPYVFTYTYITSFWEIKNESYMPLWVPGSLQRFQSKQLDNTHTIQEATHYLEGRVCVELVSFCFACPT